MFTLKMAQTARFQLHVSVKISNERKLNPCAQTELCAKHALGMNMEPMESVLHTLAVSEANAVTQQ